MSVPTYKRKARLPVNIANEGKMSLTKNASEVKEKNSHEADSLPIDVDYGVRARAALADSVEEGEPLTATPELCAMLELLANDGHSIDGAIDELNRLKGTVSLHLTVHRQITMQVASVQSAHAAILSRRSR